MPAMWSRSIGLLVLLLLASAQQARADQSWFGFDISLRMLNRFNYKTNFLLSTDNSMSASPGLGIGAPKKNSQSGPQVISYEDPLSLRFNKGELGYSALLGISTRFSFGSALALQLSFDSGELKFPCLIRYQPPPQCDEDDSRCSVTSNGQPIEDEARSAFFIRELFFDLGLGEDNWFSAKAGKLLLSTGNGFIMDNYALGLSTSSDLDLGFGLPFRLSADLVFPDGRLSSDGKRSPYLYVDVAWQMSFLEELGLFFAWYHDGDDSLAMMMSSIVRDAYFASGQLDEYSELTHGGEDVRTAGNLFWFGLRANRIFDRASLSGTAIVELGTIDISTLGTSRQAAMFGGMLDARFHYDVTDWLTLGTFFLFLSGETFSRQSAQQGSQDHYSSFISVFPYITHTNIFFSGGMNQNFSARSFSASGVNGRGVIAPGLTAGFDLGEQVTVRLVGAALFSHGKHLLSDGRFYGFESDLNLDWAINRHLRLMFEADYLWTGDFFDFAKPVCAPYEYGEPRNLTTIACDPAVWANEPGVWKIMVGLDVMY